MLSSLKEGDDIVTIGGIYGKILNLKEDVVTLDIGDKINDLIGILSNLMRIIGTHADRCYAFVHDRGRRDNSIFDIG